MNQDIKYSSRPEYAPSIKLNNFLLSPPKRKSMQPPGEQGHKTMIEETKSMEMEKTVRQVSEPGVLKPRPVSTSRKTG